MIKISVLIPVYNSEKYLVRCLNSVINQSLKDIEIIIANDGSKDSSLKIIKEFQKEDKRIKIIDKINEGVVKTRNILLKYAIGKYCINIDSDDWIEKDYLQRIYLEAEKNNLDLVVSDIIIDYGKNNEYVFTDLRIKDNEIINGDKYFKLFLTENFYGYTWNKLIKRELLIKNNISYNEKIYFLCEDTNIILKICKYSKRIGKLNKAYYHYMQTDTNGSKNLNISHLYDIYECFNDLIDFYNKDLLKIVLLKRVKIGNLIALIIGGKFSKYTKTEKFIEELLDEFKEIPFLLNKYPRESYFKILGLNLIKLFPTPKTIFFLQTLYKFTHK